MITKDIETLLASKLLQISAIKLQLDSPFVWASGWSSPIYTDLRLTLSYPEVRNLVKVEMARLIMEHYGEAQVVAAIATGAIAQGALVADSLAMPLVYVRPQPKDHGLENQIEGDIKPGQRVVVIEDQLSTGNNCVKACQAVRDAGGEVLGAIVSFNYQFPVAARALKNEQVPMIDLTNWQTLLTVAQEHGDLTADDIETLTQWHSDPENWLPEGSDGSWG